MAKNFFGLGLLKKTKENIDIFIKHSHLNNLHLKIESLLCAKTTYSYLELLQRLLHDDKKIRHPRLINDSSALFLPVIETNDHSLPRTRGISLFHRLLDCRIPDTISRRAPIPEE